MPLIKTLSQTLKQDKEKFKVPRSVQQAIPIRKIWPVRYFSGGEQVFPDIPVYGYQLFHCQQSG